MSNTMKIILVLVAILVIFGWVGNQDYEDAVADQEHYCAMVKAGYWPAYRENTNCKEQ